ncbi:MAG: hypothetical protein ACK4UN_12445 [Limisphaerales bacterium]
MKRILLYQQSNIEIFHDQQNRWLYVDWKGYQTVGFVQGGCEQMLNFLVATGVNKVLNDNTNVTGIWIGASDWVGKDWMPRMCAKGLRHFAWVYSPSRLSQVSTDAALEAAKTPVIQMFYSVAEAEEYLRNQR